MASDKKAKAVGAFLMASTKFDNIRGGKQKLQKIVGERIFYQSENGKKWFFNTKAISNKTISELEELTKKIKDA
jgi:hypothetical protein